MGLLSRLKFWEKIDSCETAPIKESPGVRKRRALISKCPRCNFDISNATDTCVNCGYDLRRRRP